MTNEIHAAEVGSAVATSTVGNWVVKIGSIAAALIMFRFVEPAIYGEWRLVLATAGFIQGWLSAPVALITVEAIRSKASGDHGFDGLAAFRGYISIVLGTTSVVLIATIIAAQPISDALHLSHSYVVILAALWLTVNSCKIAALIWIQVTYRFSLYLKMMAVEAASYPLFLAGLLIWGKLGLAGIVLSALLSGIGGLLMVSPLLKDLWNEFKRHQTRKDLSAFSTLVKSHGKWAIATAAFKGVQDSGRTWMIGLLLGPTALGLYGLAESLLGHIASLVNYAAPLNAALPRLVGEPERLVAASARSSRVGTMISTLIAIGSWLTVPWVIPWIFPKYAPATVLYLTFSAVLLYGGIGAVINALYPAMRLQRALFMWLIARTAITFVILYVGLPVWGVWAISAEYIIGSTFYIVGRWMYLKRRLGWNMPLRKMVVPRADDLKEVWRLIRAKMPFKKQERPI